VGTPKRFLFGLAPSGVYPAITVTNEAVCFYHTFSPLPSYILFALDIVSVYRADRNPHGYWITHDDCIDAALAKNPIALSIVSPEATLRLGGIFSVALSVGLRLPGITWHFARWSPDFPL
jgi:hypothetical protein